MTQTFTLEPTCTEKALQLKSPSQEINSEGPSDLVIQTILNFSKNLEVQSSRLIPPIELIKS